MSPSTDALPSGTNDSMGQPKKVVNIIKVPLPDIPKLMKKRDMLSMTSRGVDSQEAGRLTTRGATG